MQSMRQLGGGLILGLLSVVIVVGAIIVTLAEGNAPASSATQPPQIASAESGFPTSESVPGSLDFLLTPFPSDTPTPGGIVIFTDTALPILPTDTFAALPTALIILPSQPTFTPIPCGAPFGWARYIVQAGDNLYRISLLYRITVSQLQQANCLGASTLIYVGQKLWVPNIATSTLPATPINIEFPTVTLAPTNTFIPTATDTSAPPEPPTATPTATATETIPPAATTPPTSP